MISRVATSPHLSWFVGFESTGRKTSFEMSSRCSNAVPPPSSVESTTLFSAAISSLGSECTLLIMIRSFVFGSFLGIATSSLSESPMTRQNFSSDSNQVSMKLMFSSVLNAFSNLAPASLGNVVRMRSRTKSMRGSGASGSPSSLPMVGGGASLLRLRARASGRA